MTALAHQRDRQHDGRIERAPAQTGEAGMEREAVDQCHTDSLLGRGLGRRSDPQAPRGERHAADARAYAGEVRDLHQAGARILGADRARFGGQGHIGEDCCGLT